MLKKYEPPAPYKTDSGKLREIYFGNLNIAAHFSADGHLSDLGIALYVDALMLERVSELPTELQNHTETCDDCRRAAMELYDAVSATADADSATHPYFGADRSTQTAQVESETNFFYLARIAAALVLSVGLGAFVYFSAYKQADRTESGITSPVAELKAPTGESAAAPLRADEKANRLNEILKDDSEAPKSSPPAEARTGEAPNNRQERNPSAGQGAAVPSARQDAALSQEARSKADVARELAEMDKPLPAPALTEDSKQSKPVSPSHTGSHTGSGAGAGSNTGAGKGAIEDKSAQRDEAEPSAPDVAEATAKKKSAPRGAASEVAPSPVMPPAPAPSTPSASPADKTLERSRLSLTLYSPAEGATVAAPVSFKWDAALQAPLKLKVFGGERFSQLLFDQAVSGNAYVLTQPLPAGAYRWQLFSSDASGKLLHTGTFLVK